MTTRLTETIQDFFEVFGIRPSKKLMQLLFLVGLLYSAAFWLDGLQKNIMIGNWNIAFAGFSADDPLLLTYREAYILNSQFYNKLESDIQDIRNPDTVIQVWGPDETPSVTGHTPEQKLLSAERIANSVNANVVIYGFVERIGSILYLQTEFYVSNENFYELEEIAGPYNLGPPIPIMEINGTVSSQIRLNQELSERTRLLSLISQGLGLLYSHDYDSAYEIFLEANSNQYWVTNENRETLYVFLGNSAIRANRENEAETAFLKSLEINSKYDRAKVGLAGVKYLQALAGQSTDSFNPDVSLLTEALFLYEGVLGSDGESSSPDIKTKIFFGLGQLYLARWLAGEATLELAVSYFNQVIADFGNGNNPRLAELAAESHARLGFIQRQLKNLAAAIFEFETALNISTNPTRKGLYWITLGELLDIRGNDASLPYSNAIGEYRIALDKSTSNQIKADLLAQIAYCYAKLDNFPEAIRAITDAIALAEPGSSEKVTYEELLTSFLNQR